MIKPLSPADIERLRQRQGAAPRQSEPAAIEAPAAGLVAFTKLRFRDYRPAPIHRLIAERLEQVERREIKRLMLLFPPRHGKSTLASQSIPPGASAGIPRGISSVARRASISRGVGALTSETSSTVASSSWSMRRGSSATSRLLADGLRRRAAAISRSASAARSTATAATTS